jgi:hypothetical protein
MEAARKEEKQKLNSLKGTLFNQERKMAAI